VQCPRCSAEAAVFVPSEDAIEGCPECEADEWTDAELETLRTLAMEARYDAGYDGMCRNGGDGDDD
jgi:Zn-finger nucleic acid-binding protein